MADTPETTTPETPESTPAAEPAANEAPPPKAPSKLTRWMGNFVLGGSVIMVVAVLLAATLARFDLIGKLAGFGPFYLSKNPAWALLAIGTAFFLAEFGDKTMLAAMTLATTEEPIGVWLGATFGMVAANAIAVAIGAAIGTRLPERWIRLFAAGAFALFGVVLIAQGVGLG